MLKCNRSKSTRIKLIYRCYYWCYCFIVQNNYLCSQTDCILYHKYF